MVTVFEAEAEEDKAGDHERCAEPDNGETRFGFEDAVVALHVDAGCEVVEPMAGHKAEEGCNDGGKVKKAYVRLSLEHANNMDKKHQVEVMLPICFNPKL